MNDLKPGWLLWEVVDVSDKSTRLAKPEYIVGNVRLANPERLRVQSANAA